MRLDIGSTSLPTLPTGLPQYNLSNAMMKWPRSRIFEIVTTSPRSREAPDVEDAVAVSRRIAREVLRVYAADVDANARFPVEAIDALREHRLLGLAVPTQYGGVGGGPVMFAAVAEELAEACGSTAMIFVMHTAATRAIVASDTLAARDEVLRAIARGDHLTTLAFSEVGSRSHFWAPVSSMTPHGGDFETTARKAWVTSANHADSYVASAQAHDASTVLETTLYLTRRGGAVRVSGTFNGLGLRGNDSAPVTIDNARVSHADLLTRPGEGGRHMLRVVLPWFCIGTAAMANGLCRAAVAATAEHLQDAGYERTGQKLRDLPTLRARLADMSVRTEQSRALLARTAGELERSSDSLLLFAFEARLSAIQAAVDVTDLAMKACGGAAFSGHLTIERLFRDARAGWVMSPTADHLQDFIGKTLTGLPLF
jgi:alkylation response protein AidB-like acyl-CoA dehydrogenase